MAELLKKCWSLPADPEIDGCLASVRTLAGPGLDSPEGRGLLGLLEHLRRARLTRVRRQWSFRWLHDFCRRYFDHLRTHEGLLRHTVTGRAIIGSRGLDRANDFRAFWEIARTVAELRPLPGQPEETTGLSIAEVEAEVGRLMSWCAEHARTTESAPTGGAPDATRSSTAETPKAPAMPAPEGGEVRPPAGTGGPAVQPNGQACEGPLDGPYEEGGEFGLRINGVKRPFQSCEAQPFRIIRYMWPPIDLKEFSLKDVMKAVGSTAKPIKWATNEAAKARKPLGLFGVPFTIEGDNDRAVMWWQAVPSGTPPRESQNAGGEIS